MSRIDEHIQTTPLGRHKSKARRRKSAWRGARRVSPPGAAPGSMHIDPSATPTTIRVISCSEGHCTDRENVSVVDLTRILRSATMTWVDVTGLGTDTTLRKIAELIEIHPLAMEDVLNVNQRAKVDQFGDTLFVVARMVDTNDASESEQISFILKPGVVVSFQQRPGDCWGGVRNRLHDGRGAIRNHEADYLFYCLLDSVIDSYYPFIDNLADELDQIDESITLQLADGSFDRLHHLRAQLLTLRRIIRPHRDMVNQLIRDEYALIKPETRIFLRDCYDHVIHVIDSAETYNEAANGIRDYYMTMVSNKMNEIMKVLTIMSSIFIPLSFIVGLYGMNFDTSLPGNMPELNLPYAYLVVLGFMASVAVGLILYFRRRRWI